MIVVSNSSSLIALSWIKQFPLLKKLFEKIIIPPSVYDEVVAKGEGKPGEKELKEALEEGWIRKMKPDLSLTLPYGGMKKGEREAIALAVEENIGVVLMDEGPGRKRVEKEGLDWLGTLDLFLRGKDHGFISSVKELLQDLHKAGFYLTPEVYEDTLRKAGES